MLNGKGPLSLLNEKKAMPWSAAARPGIRLHHRDNDDDDTDDESDTKDEDKAALAQTKAAPQKPSNSIAQNATKPASVKEKKAAPVKKDEKKVEATVEAKVAAAKK